MPAGEIYKIPNIILKYQIVNKPILQTKILCFLLAFYPKLLPLLSLKSFKYLYCFFTCENDVFYLQNKNPGAGPDHLSKSLLNCFQWFGGKCD